MDKADIPGIAQKQIQDRKWLFWTLRILPPVLLLGFILLNTQVVTIRFLFWTVSTTLIWALGTAAGLGFLIGYFAHRLKR